MASFQAFAMSVHYKNASGHPVPLDSSQPKLVMYLADEASASKVKGGELGSFFSYETISTCPEVGTAKTVVGYTPPAGATMTGWQTPADIIDNSTARAFKDVSTWGMASRFNRVFW